MSIGVEPMYESIALAALVLGIGTMLGMIFVALSALAKEHMNLALRRRHDAMLDQHYAKLFRAEVSLAHQPRRLFLDTYRTGV